MADLIVYGFNNGFELASGLTSILHFMGGPEWAGLAYLGACLAVVMGIWGSKGADYVTLLKGIAAPALVYYAILVPKVDVQIIDDFTHETYNVDDIPLGIGLSLQVTSTLEKLMREMADDYLQPPNGPEFAQWDFMGHVRSMDLLLQQQISLNDDLYHTVADYVQNCVLHAIANGDLTGSTIANSPNLMDTMALDYDVFLTKIYYPDGTEKIDTCANVYDYLAGAITTEAGSNETNKPAERIRSRIDKRAVKSVADVRAALDNMFATIFPGYQNTAQKAFEQMFWINGIKTNLAINNPEALAYWSQASADQRQQSVIAAMSYLENLNDFIPMLKLFVIFLFPFIGTLFLTMSGKPFAYWFSALCFVTLWSPTEAVVHAAVNHFLMDELQRFNVMGGITYKTHLSMNATLMQYVGPAAMLAMTIPGLASLVLGWLAPKAVGAIAGPLMLGSHRFATTASSSADQSQSETQRRAQQEEEMKLERMWNEAANQYQYWRNTANMRHGQMTGVFGQVPQSSAFGSGVSILRGPHLADQKIQVQAGTQYTKAAQELRSVSGSFTQQAGTNLTVATLTGDGQQAVITAAENAFRNGTASEMVKGDKGAEWALQYANKLEKSHSLDNGMSKEEAFTMLSRIAASVGLSIAGFGGKIQGIAELSQKWSQKEQDLIKTLFGDTQNLVKNFKENVGIDYAKGLQKQLGLQTGQNYSDSAVAQKNINDTVNRLRTWTKMRQIVSSMSDDLRDVAGNSISTTVNMAEIFGALNDSHFGSMRNVLEESGFNRTLDKIENGMLSSTTEKQAELSYEFAKAGREKQIDFLESLKSLPGLSDVIKNKIDMALTGLKEQNLDQKVAELRSLRFALQKDTPALDEVEARQKGIETGLSEEKGRIEKFAEKKLNQGETVKAKVKTLKKDLQKEVPAPENKNLDVQQAIKDVDAWHQRAKFNPRDHVGEVTIVDGKLKGIKLGAGNSLMNVVVRRGDKTEQYLYRVGDMESLKGMALTTEEAQALSRGVAMLTQNGEFQGGQVGTTGTAREVSMEDRKTMPERIYDTMPGEIKDRVRDAENLNGQFAKKVVVDSLSEASKPTVRDKVVEGEYKAVSGQSVYNTSEIPTIDLGDSQGLKLLQERTQPEQPVQTSQPVPSQPQPQGDPMQAQNPFKEYRQERSDGGRNIEEYGPNVDDISDVTPDTGDGVDIEKAFEKDAG